MPIVKLHIRKNSPAEEIDLDDLTPKARALGEAIHMSLGQQPLGVLIDTGRTKGENPNHARLYGTGDRAAEIGAQPDHRFMRNLEPLPADAATSAVEWLERNARSMPFDAWPIAGAASRIHPLDQRVPSADAAREDRCLTRSQTLDYLADHGIALGKEAWRLLQRAGNAPAPWHFAAGGLLPLWHIDDVDAYAARPVERWTLTQAAEHLGIAPPSARGQLSRWEIGAIGRVAGRGGESEYAADQIRAAHAARPGRGARTDLRPA